MCASMAGVSWCARKNPIITRVLDIHCKTTGNAGLKLSTIVSKWWTKLSSRGRIAQGVGHISGRRPSVYQKRLRYHRFDSLPRDQLIYELSFHPRAVQASA